jgi:hypothetical protein
MGTYHGSPQGVKHLFENKKAAASITVFTE